MTSIGERFMRNTPRASKLVLFTVLAVLMWGMPPVAAASAAGVTTWTRIAGVDRYETAAAVSKSGFPDGAPAAVVASGEKFPDGLSASYLAGQVGGPVLLTNVASLPAATLAELTRLKVAKVYLDGGTGAVSAAVADRLAALKAPTGGPVIVIRLAGADRYATAAAIASAFPADKIGTIGGHRVALLASGTGFADALAGSAAAAGAHLPLLLTTPDRLSAPVLPTLETLGVSQVIILGGPGAVSAVVAKQLTDAGLAITRLGGTDRVATATLIADWEISTLGFTGEQVAIARGDQAGQGVDALSLGIRIGAAKHPLLLAASPTSLGSSLTSWLGANTTLTGGIVAGGLGAISASLMKELAEITGGTTTPGPVTNVIATSTSSSISLSWTNPSGASFTGVMIRRALGGTPPASASAGSLVTDAAKPATSYPDTGLASGTQYSYALFAHNGVPVYAVAATVTATTAARHDNRGPLDHLVLAPASATITAGGSQAYTARGFDASNNDLGDVTSATIFTVVGGSCTAAVCSPTTAGDHTVTGTDGAATGIAALHANVGVGSAWAWGDYSVGQQGTTTTDRVTPVPVGTAPWASVAAGIQHTVAVKTDGTLWAWGDNTDGQLGDGTTTSRVTPVQVGTATDWASVAAGGYHTVAVKTNGTLWAWGRNGSGQLGDGTTTSRDAPVQEVGTDTDWASVAAGGSHTVAVKTDGTLWAWGENGNGQLGYGGTTDQHAPGQVGSALWASVAAGGSHTVAVKKTDGTLWAWGNNSSGQLGDGTTMDRLVPVQVGTGWASVAAGYSHTVAVKKTDGTLWAWGYDYYGQLGDGDSRERYVPVQVGIDTNWASVAAGFYHTVAVKTTGTLWAWGFNSAGQLGNGTTATERRPVQVGIDTNWASVAAGGYHTIGLRR